VKAKIPISVTGTLTNSGLEDQHQPAEGLSAERQYLPGNFCRRRGDPLTAQGFTLLEILVVVFIIGIVLSLVVIAVNPDKGNDLKSEAGRFIALMSLAHQESILRSKEFAVELAHDGYTFLNFEELQWAAASDDVFRARSLPKGIYMEVYLEGAQFDFINADEEEETNPRIFILSSGEMMPFEIILRQENSAETVHITGDISGNLSMDEQE